jgi:hypothetical protein
MTDVSEALIASIMIAMIVLMVEAVNISETSVNFYETTRLSIAEYCGRQLILSLFIRLKYGAFHDKLRCRQ